MNERANPFANLKDAPIFAPKPKPEKSIAPEALAEIAEDNNFTSRQSKPVKKVERRKSRVHRTGRNVQFNAKGTMEIISRVYKQADERKVTLGEWMELAADALDRAGVLRQSQEPS